MCYNTEYVGYEQKRRKQERILFMGGGNTASKLRAGCVPVILYEEQKRDD